MKKKEIAKKLKKIDKQKIKRPRMVPLISGINSNEFDIVNKEEEKKHIFNKVYPKEGN